MRIELQPQIKLAVRNKRILRRKFSAKKRNSRGLSSA